MLPPLAISNLNLHDALFAKSWLVLSSVVPAVFHQTKFQLEIRIMHRDRDRDRDRHHVEASPMRQCRLPFSEARD